MSASCSSNVPRSSSDIVMISSTTPIRLSSDPCSVSRNSVALVLADARVAEHVRDAFGDRHGCSQFVRDVRQEVGLGGGALRDPASQSPSSSWRSSSVSVRRSASVTPSSSATRGEKATAPSAAGRRRRRCTLGSRRGRPGSSSVATIPSRRPQARGHAGRGRRSTGAPRSRSRGDDAWNRVSSSVPANPSIERRQSITSGRMRAAASIARRASVETSTTRSGWRRVAACSAEIAPGVSQSSTERTMCSSYRPWPQPVEESWAGRISARCRCGSRSPPPGPGRSR